MPRAKKRTFLPSFLLGAIWQMKSGNFLWVSRCRLLLLLLLLLLLFFSPTFTPSPNPTQQQGATMRKKRKRLKSPLFFCRWSVFSLSLSQGWEANEATTTTLLCALLILKPFWKKIKTFCTIVATKGDAHNKKFWRSFPPAPTPFFFMNALSHISRPNHQRWHAEWKLSRNMYYTLRTRFHTFGADLHAQSVLINKISASELSRKFAKSALLVGKSPLPTQPPTVACKMEAQSKYVHTRCTHVFARLAPIGVIGWCSLAKPFLHPSSVGIFTASALLVGECFFPALLAPSLCAKWPKNQPLACNN